MAELTVEPAPSATQADSRGAVVAALMLTVGLAAIDSTIVATAVPQIVGDLGGFSLFPWIFSIYLLTQAVTVPIYGRLSDVFGRKPVLLVGVAGFLVGSILCGLAWSMVALIVFRGVQGLAAGAILPTTSTIVGDLYSPAERGRIQGYIASVWGVSAILGPALGGFFAQYWTWRGIFWLNLPVGLGAAWLVQRYLHEHVERRSHRIDYPGALALSAACALLILALLEGGVSWAWTSVASIALFVLAAALLAAFIWIERTVAEPILPLWIFRQRTLVAGNLAGLAIGAILIGQSSYVPTYAQRVVGVGAVVAGLAMAAMTIGWPIAATLAPRVYLRIDYRPTAVLGGVIAVGGCALLALFVGEGSGIWRVAVASFVLGVGLGFASVATVVAVQSVVGWDRRGVVTGSNMFIRTLGSAVGIAVFGSIANGRLAHRRHTGAAIYHAVHGVFWALVVVAVLGVVAQVFLPRKVTALD
ncbi:MAG TPA: MDR family MFS transporter [Gaiellaceae bacterium]|jgi:EmrB/QacA subfamily drug resistance transporter|nr:MDR family MFS transporter [Gaiellaceae bacterium]